MIRRLHVRIILPEGHPEGKFDIAAPPKHHFLEPDIEARIEKVIDNLDKRYPYWEFRMVRVGRDRVNFIYDGLRKGASDGVEPIPTSDL